MLTSNGATMLPDAPTILRHDKLYLSLGKVVPADEPRGLSPYYHYRIHLPEGTDAGHLNFRVGNTPHIMQAAGHIGFEILPDYRGSSLSYHACLAILPFVSSVYKTVILTSNPDNAASLRIIEKLGARFLNEVAVAPNDPHYVSGATVKRRYEWELADGVR